MSIIIGILEEGLIYAILALGVYITYKILDFPDLSVDGTFPLGAAVTAMLILKGVSPVLTLFLAFLAGALAGCVTGFIHVKLRVRDLLSGIIMMTALYSINLRIAGKANLPIFSKATIFDNALLNAVLFETLEPFGVVLVLLVITLICKLLLDLYLNTRSGYLLRAVGDNDVLVTSLAKDKGMVKLAGLAIANGFVALAGCVYCQQPAPARAGILGKRKKTPSGNESHHSRDSRLSGLSQLCGAGDFPGNGGIRSKAGDICIVPDHPGNEQSEGKEGDCSCLSLRISGNTIMPEPFMRCVCSMIFP